MSRTKNRMIGTLAAALVAGALVPGVSAAYQDLRLPDTRDAAEQSVQASGSQDLRSPDTRDAAEQSVQASGSQASRSPDALDAARSLPPNQLAEVSRGLRTSGTPTRDSAGTEWGDVGIVAGGVVTAIGLAGLVLFARRRGSVRKSQAHVVSS